MTLQERIDKIENLRERLSDIRKEFREIREDKLWEDYILPCEGGITCVLIASYDAKITMEKHKKRWNIK